MAHSLTFREIALIILVASLALLPGLGSPRLSYHEAIWAQSAVESREAGHVLIPLLDGRPWLEKPPLGIWLIEFCTHVVPREAGARLPSAIAAAILALSIATLACRRFGHTVGFFAGLIQATTAWSVIRGRLAEPDIILAALIASAIAAFERVRLGNAQARWSFFMLIGLTCLVKGIGFGACLIGLTTVFLLIWDRDWQTVKRLRCFPSILIAFLIGLMWPLLICKQHPEALQLWVMHVTDRFAAHPSQFSGETWAEYIVSPFWQTLPWTPLALLGMASSIRKQMDRHQPDPGKRLLWAWTIVPVALVSLASVRNGHYLIHALPPWSIWAALAVEARHTRRAITATSLRHCLLTVNFILACVFASAFIWLVPCVDTRGEEWTFYDRVRGYLKSEEPVVVLYDDWDRLPYLSPFGPMPHDLPVRLYYLRRAVTHYVIRGGGELHIPPQPFAAIGRERDQPFLEHYGEVRVGMRGPTRRWDRCFVLFSVDPTLSKPTATLANASLKR